MADTTANPTGNIPASPTAAAPNITIPKGQGGPSKMHMHPMAFESKHFVVGLLIGFVAGAGLGVTLYFKKEVTSIWSILGFAVLGGLLGIGIGMAIPARKVVAKHFDGKVEYHYC